MKATLFRALAARRLELLATAKAQAGNLDREAVAALDQDLATIDHLGTQLSSRESWRAPVLVAAVSMILVALASVIRMPLVTLSLDAQVHSLELVTDDDRGETGWTSEPIRVRDVEFGGGTVGPDKVGVITSLKVQPGTLVRITARPASCLLLEVRQGREGGQGGAQIEVLRPTREGSMPETYSVMLLPGSDMHFCPVDSDGEFLVGRVRLIDVSRQRFAGPPELRSSSLLLGTLRIKETDEQMTLSQIDMLRFSSIRDGAVQIGVGKPLHLVFSGIVAEPLHGEGLQVQSRSLRPTLLQIVSSSPLLRGLLGALTGLVGLIWAGLRYLQL